MHVRHRFGTLQSNGRHFFNEDHEIYRFVAEVCALRDKHLALRRGRQYLHESSETGAPGSFGLPRMIGGQIRSVVPWSRLFDDKEVLCAINTDANQPRAAWVTVDASLQGGRAALTCLYSTDAAQIGVGAPVAAYNGRAVHIQIPPGSTGRLCGVCLKRNFISGL